MEFEDRYVTWSLKYTMGHWLWLRREIDVECRNIWKRECLFRFVPRKPTHATAVDLLRWLISFMKSETMSDTQLNLIPIICPDVAVMLFSGNLTFVRQKHSTQFAAYSRQTNFSFGCSTVNSPFNKAWSECSTMLQLNKYRVFQKELYNVESLYKYRW
jgi:hypothetical protein